jgi:prepilin-type N-terminal cleavage/methylation domain-containing protein
MKKGFTLIEVLAVIVVLAVIMVITIPTVNNVIENRKKDSFLISAKAIAREVEYDKVSSSTFVYAPLSNLNLSDISSIDYDLNNSNVYVENGVYKTNLVGMYS